MPVTIPAGTKFEAIKPTTNVNRRSALVNANDLTYTIEDIAAAAGGSSFTITNNYIPRGNASGSIVDSNLYQGDQGYGTTLEGQLVGGINILTQPFVNLLTVVNDTLGGYNYAYLGDISGAIGPLWGFTIDSSPLNATVSISTYGNNVLYFFPPSGQYEIGGSISRFGMVNGDTPQSAMYFTPDLVTNVGGTNYIKVIMNGTAYKIELVP